MSTADEILAKMAAARKRIAAMPSPGTEIRMHPDDYNDLRQFRHEAPDAPMFWGARVVIDESAPRLPKR